jgi:hypothetical protein
LHVKDSGTHLLIIDGRVRASNRRIDGAPMG